MKEHLRREWYSRQDVQSNIVPLLRGRETAFMVPFSLRKQTGNYPVRCVKEHASSYLLNNMTAFQFFKREYNLYHSIFLLNNMPQFTYHALKRTEQQQAFFRNYASYVVGVDFVMDFDGDKKLSLNERVRAAQLQTMKVTLILDKYKVPYNVVFSGTKGFHVEVRDFPPTRNMSERTRVFQQIAIRLVLLANGFSPQLATDESREDELREALLHCSFDSSIYNTTRIWKVPYSYDVSTDLIAMPLDDEELATFQIEKYTVENMLQKNHWRKGLKKREGEIKNFWTMAAEELGVMEK